MSNLQKRNIIEMAGLFLILGLAAYLRLANVGNNPEWYTDEGTHLNIAQNLLAGQQQYLAINQSTLLFAKLPLFEGVLAGVLAVTGGGMGSLRALTGMLGVLSVGMLYGVVRRTQNDQRLAALSALLLAIYPPALLYSRFGFSYNLLTPLVLLTYLGLWEYCRCRNSHTARRSPPSPPDPLSHRERGRTPSTIVDSTLLPPRPVGEGGWGGEGRGRGRVLRTPDKRGLALAALAIGVGTLCDLWMFSLLFAMILVVVTRSNDPSTGSGHRFSRFRPAPAGMPAASTPSPSPNTRGGEKEAPTPSPSPNTRGGEHPSGCREHPSGYPSLPSPSIGGGAGGGGRFRDLWWCVPLALLPFACYVGLMGLFAPQAFLFDLQYTFFRLQKLSLGQQLSTLYLNYSTLFLQENWMAPATIGLLMLRPLRLQRLTLLLFLLPITILGRTVALFSLSFYYMIPLLPFVALGMAVLVGRVIPSLAQAMLDLLLNARQRAAGSGARPLWTIDASPATASRIIPLILALIIAMPFANSLTQTIQQIEHGFTTPIDPFLLNGTDAHQTAAFINRQVAPHDLIIASPTIAWLFQANSADFQMSTAFTGQETVHLPANIPPNRFAFDAHYSQARFVVVDNLWHNWAIWHVAGVSDMMHNVQKWPLLFQAGEINVYRNPRQ